MQIQLLIIYLGCSVIFSPIFFCFSATLFFTFTHYFLLLFTTFTHNFSLLFNTFTHNFLILFTIFAYYFLLLFTVFLYTFQYTLLSSPSPSHFILFDFSYFLYPYFSLSYTLSNPYYFCVNFFFLHLNLLRFV